MALSGLSDAASNKRKQDAIEDSSTVPELHMVPQKKKRTQIHKPAASAIGEDTSFDRTSKPTATVQASFAPCKRTLEDLHESKTVDDEPHCSTNRPIRSRKLGSHIGEGASIYDKYVGTDCIPAGGQMVAVSPAQDTYPSFFRSVPHAPMNTITALHRTAVSLENLSAELLELIAWYSLSPTFSLTSRKIYNKLGRIEDVRRDMVTFLFCQPVVHLHVSKLPLKTPIAPSTSPVLTAISVCVCNVRGRHRVRRRAWCFLPQPRPELLSKNPHGVDPHGQFALPDTPRSILLAPKDDQKKTALLFYNRHERTTLSLAPSRELPVCLSATACEGLVAAIKDDASAIQRLLLHERGGIASGWYDSKLRPRWRMSGQHILALLACTGQWKTIMNVSDDLLDPRPLMDLSQEQPIIISGLGALDDAAKAFILQQADEAAHNTNDIVAYSMLALWVKEPGEDVPRSWLRYLEGADQHYRFHRAYHAFAEESGSNLRELGRTSTNRHALVAANKKVVRKLEQLEKQVNRAMTARLTSEVGTDGMQRLVQLQANTACNTS